MNIKKQGKNSLLFVFLGMERKQLIDAVHGAIYNRNIREIKEVKDFYRDIKSSNLKKLDLTIVNNDIEAFNFILSQQDYDINELFKTGYTNSELKDYFKVYKESLEFDLKCYQENKFIITIEDFD